MVEPCEFIHKLFYCSDCGKYVECVTQTSIEDVCFLVKKLERTFKKKGYEIHIKNPLEVISKTDDISYLNSIFLPVIYNDKIIGDLEFPVKRGNEYDRSYYFEVKKKACRDKIKNLLG